MEINLVASHDNDLNLKATELRLGLPGTDEEMTTKNNNKRSLPESATENGPKGDAETKHVDQETAPAAK